MNVNTRKNNELVAAVDHPISPPRRGSAVVMVLTILAVTMTLAYAVLRSQGTAVQIQSNSNRLGSARQAAQAGMAAAMRAMSTNGWSGVTSTLAGSISPRDTYTVTYTVGDALLLSTDPAYSEYPYRVTITSVGYSSDPANASVTSKHTIQQVMCLIPRALNAEPTEFTQMLNYTLFQFSNDAVQMEPATRIEGKVRLQGALSLDTGEGWSTTIKNRWISDIGQMRLNGYADYRPFNAQVDLAFSSTDSTTRGYLTSQLGLAVTDLPQASTSSSWSFPTGISSYVLYTGGPSYAVQSVSGTLSGVTLKPNPVSNPLGLFYSSGDLTIGNNVKLTGTLIVNGAINITGDGSQLTAFSGPNLDGATKPIQLPVVISAGKFDVKSSADGDSIKGAVVVFDEYLIETRSESSAFSIEGRLMAEKLTFQPRTEWVRSGSTWSLLYSWFSSQSNGSNNTIYLPLYIWFFNSDPTPTVTVVPETTPANYHWHKPNNPVFVPTAADNGALLWEFRSCVELP